MKPRHLLIAVAALFAGLQIVGWINNNCYDANKSLDAYNRGAERQRQLEQNDADIRAAINANHQ